MVFTDIPEILDLIVRYLHTKDTCNVRLVSRNLAHVGAHYLLPSYKIARLKESFDILDEIRKHPILKANLKHLTFYLNGLRIYRFPKLTSTVEAERMIENLRMFQENKKDLVYLQAFLHEFPSLKSIHLVQVPFNEDEDADESHNHTISPWLVEQLEALWASFGLELCYDNLHDLDFKEVYSVFKHFRSLKISSLSPEDLCSVKLNDMTELRHLKVNINDDSRLDVVASPWTRPICFFDDLEMLKELQISMAVSYDIDRHMPLNFTLPPKLNRLDVSYVSFAKLELPSSLRKLKLTNVKLMGGYLSDWPGVLEKLHMDCVFGGTLHASLSGELQEGEYRDCDDELLGTNLGKCLQVICRPQFPVSLQQRMLREMFAGECRRLAVPMSGKIIIPTNLAAEYFAFIEKNPSAVDNLGDFDNRIEPFECSDNEDVKLPGIETVIASLENEQIYP